MDYRWDAYADNIAYAAAEREYTRLENKFIGPTVDNPVGTHLRGRRWVPMDKVTGPRSRFWTWLLIIIILFRSTAGRPQGSYGNTGSRAPTAYRRQCRRQTDPIFSPLPSSPDQTSPARASLSKPSLRFCPPAGPPHLPPNAPP